MKLYYVTIGVATEEELSHQRQHRLAETSHTLVNVAGMEVVDAKSDLRIEKIYYIHEHTSNEDFACNYCQAIGGDEKNKDSLRRI